MTNMTTNMIIKSVCNVLVHIGQNCSTVVYRKGLEVFFVKQGEQYPTIETGIIVEHNDKTITGLDWDGQLITVGLVDEIGQLSKQFFCDTPNQQEIKDFVAIINEIKQNCLNNPNSEWDGFVIY